MSDSLSSRDVIEQLVKQAGINKKLATELIHALPDLIEEGLKRDGEVRVKGLGTFRLKWIKERVGRNPKTGERVPIPPHNRMVFLPESSFKAYINRDMELLSYEVIDEEVKKPAKEEVFTSFVHETLGETIIVTESQPEATEEPTKTKRRVHWIIPTAIAVIIILSVIFYFRNFYTAPDSQVAETSSQVAVPGSQVAAEQNEVPVETKDTSAQIASEPVQPASENQQQTESTQHATLNTQHTTLTVPEGKRLFQLARESYGNPFLWVLIYRANKDKIADPDMLITGTELNIPALEGTPGKLTRNDSLAISEGYQIVYDYFKAKNDPRSENFLKGIERYKP